MTNDKRLKLASDYFNIFLGLLIYSVGFTCFMLPYHITSGGVSGISAVIYYATGFKANYSYLIINSFLLLLAIRTMGWKYFIRTIIATLAISTMIDVLQEMITLPDGTMQKFLGEQKFMACVVGGLLEGLGLSFVFLSGGSTGGTDIIASSINKYWDISLGRMLLFLDILIISSSYLVFRDIETTVVGYCTMLVSMNFLDYMLNGANQSVQFTIISNKYEDIADKINTQIPRGVTLLHAQGWYSKEERRVLLVMARKRESRRIFTLIKDIDPNAFVTMSNVEGVFGEGFDKIKKQSIKE